MLLCQIVEYIIGRYLYVKIESLLFIANLHVLYLFTYHLGRYYNVLFVDDFIQS